MTCPAEHMSEALSLARKGLLTTRPNPMVGCVITHNEKIIGRGWHEKSGDNHAEINAIHDVFRNLGSNAESALENSEMYVTLEPCSTTGKTPPCSEAIKKYGIKKVFIASEDNSQDGFANKTDGIEIEVGLLREDARRLNRGFFSRIEKNRPFITAKMGVGLDAGIALSSGESKWITSNESRKDVHKMRAENDAILTGIGTIVADNPSLTSRDSGYDEDKVMQPLRIIIDRNNKLTGNESIFQVEGNNLIFSSNQNIDSQNTDFYPNPSNKDINLKEIVQYLAREKSINNLMIESGSGMFDALLDEQLIDEIILYQAPKLLGKDRKSFSNLDVTNEKLSTIDFQIIETTNLGEDKKIILRPNYK